MVSACAHKMALPLKGLRFKNYQDNIEAEQDDEEKTITTTTIIKNVRSNEDEGTKQIADRSDIGGNKD